MIRNMKQATLLKRTTSTNAYNEIIETWTESKTIEVAISQSTGAISDLNDVLTISATHYGYTNDKDVSVKDKIVVDGLTYSVDYIYETRRFRVLALQAEWQI